MEYSNSLEKVLINIGLDNITSKDIAKIINEAGNELNYPPIMLLALLIKINWYIGTDIKDVLANFDDVIDSFTHSNLTPDLLFIGSTKYKPSYGWRNIDHMLYKLGNLANEGVLK